MKAPLFLLTLLSGATLLVAAPLEVTPGLRGALQPQLAASPSGQVQVVFGEGNLIYTAACKDGRTFSAPVKVGELPKLALKMRRGPRIAATERGFVITAISHADGNVHVWSSADAGATWREGAPLNGTPNAAREGLHAMAANGSGEVAVAWLDGRAGGTQLWSRVSTDGGATWQPEVKVYASPEGHICECCHPSLAFGPTGRLTAMWRNWLGGSRDLWTSTSADAGRTWDAGSKLGTGTWKFNACPMDGGGLADDGTALHTVWRRERAVFAATPGQPEQKLAEGAAQPVVAAGPKDLVTAWEQYGSIQAQRGSAPPQRIAAGKAPALVRVEKLHGFFLAWESEGKGVQGELLPD